MAKYHVTPHLRQFPSSLQNNLAVPSSSLNRCPWSTCHHLPSISTTRSLQPLSCWSFTALQWPDLKSSGLKHHAQPIHHPVAYGIFTWAPSPGPPVRSPLAMATTSICCTLECIRNDNFNPIRLYVTLELSLGLNSGILLGLSLARSPKK